MAAIDNSIYSVLLSDDSGLVGILADKLTPMISSLQSWICMELLFDAMPFLPLAFSPEGAKQ